MKKVFICMCSVFLSIVIASCSNDNLFNEVTPVMKKSVHRITAEQAQQNALEFVNNFSVTTRGTTSTLKVSGVKAISGGGTITRSDGDSINTDSLFYIVNFEDNNGFVIAATDDRETPVFAYIEEGSYEEDSLANGNLYVGTETGNAGYDAFLSSLIDMEIDNRTQYHKNPDDDELYDGYEPGPITGGGITADRDKFEVMSPLLKTKWGPYSYVAYNNNEPTGCTINAVTQICSYIECPVNVCWNYNGLYKSCTMEWNRINTECENGIGITSSADLNDQISILKQFWNLYLDAEGTSVEVDNAIPKLQEIGINATSLGDYDANEVIKDLKKGDRIIYMRGNARYYHVGFIFRRYVDGHAWVVDGYIHSVKGWDIANYLHCNWGWNGDKNGYYLCNVLNAEEGPVYYDDATPTRSQNYQYRLKTSTICK